MPIVAADWSVTRSNGNIRYIGDDHGGGAPSYARVIELHRWLQGLADDASSAGNDELDITDSNPSERSTDNIITLLGSYNIDDTAAEHLYDGSIIQGSGDVIYDGIVNFGNADVQIQLIQNGAVLADDWWNFGGGGLNDDATQGISHRFMLKVRTGGADIDGRRVIGTCRRFNYVYSEFAINGTSRGNNVLALSDAADLNNQTSAATVSGWTDVTNLSEGYNGIDVNNDTTDEYYYSEWDRASRTINQFYERMKWLTRDGSASTLYGINGELFRGITHELNLTTPRAGTFSATENVSWATGTGRMVAIDSAAASTKMWLQILTGTAPGTGVTITGVTSSATTTTTGSPTERTISKPFCGASTGSAIIGAYGFGIQAADLTANDKVFDLTNTQRQPPNIVTFSLLGTVNGEDYCHVANNDTGAPDYNQLTLNTTLSGAAETAVVVTAGIPADTPATGFVRIQLDSGAYRKVAYTAWSGSTFAIGSTDFTGGNVATAPRNVYIGYIDQLAGASAPNFQGVYTSDRTMFVRVRDGGGTPIKPFETTAALTSTGGSATVIRTSDA